MPLGEHDLTERNYARLITMTLDPDFAKRNWATLLLSHLGVNRLDGREALINAATHQSPAARTEAIRGIAQLDDLATLPLVTKELQDEQ